MNSKVYIVGSGHYRFNVDVNIEQNHNSYRYTIIDKDVPDDIITTDFLSPATSAAVESFIDNILNNSYRFETIDDIYNELKNGFYGVLFSYREV